MLKRTQRLTERIEGVADAVWHDETYPCHKQWFCPEGNCTGKNKCDFAIRIERLAAYEDTGLTPEDIVKQKAKLKELRAELKQLKSTLPT